jgi:hypothetical protein
MAGDGAWNRRSPRAVGLNRWQTPSEFARVGMGHRTDPWRRHRLAGSFNPRTGLPATGDYISHRSYGQWPAQGRARHAPFITERECRLESRFAGTGCGQATDGCRSPTFGHRPSVDQANHPFPHARDTRSREVDPAHAHRITAQLKPVLSLYALEGQCDLVNEWQLSVPEMDTARPGVRTCFSSPNTSATVAPVPTIAVPRGRDPSPHLASFKPAAARPVL